MKKRYSIVRVDKDCPNRLENLGFACATSKKKFDCVNCRYGDSKEQLVRKVAQVLFKEELGWYAEYPKIIPKGKIDKPFCRNIYEHCLDKATKIVEFLGVE